jgi:phosphatidylglycerophosphatase A
VQALATKQKKTLWAWTLGTFFGSCLLKPPPIRQLERFPEGTGIMLDDVAAGLFALACGQLARVIF